MQRLRPNDPEPLFSLPVSSIPESFWITDCELIVIYRFGLLKVLPVRLGHNVGSEIQGTGHSELPGQLAQAHSEALQGACTTFSASIYRVDAAVVVSPVRNSSGAIVGTIGRVEAHQCPRPPALSVNIIPAHRSSPSTPELSAIARALFSAKGYGVCVLDSDGKVTQWSAAMETLTGISADLGCGSPIREILPDLFELEPDADARLAKGEHLWLRRLPFRFGEVQDRYFDLSLTPIKDRSHCQQGTLGIVTDVTAHIQECERGDRSRTSPWREWNAAKSAALMTPNSKQDSPSGAGSGLDAGRQVTLG